MKKKNAFTLIEMVVVIALMGVIAVVASSRFASTSVFSERVNADKLKFLLKTAQKTAMAQKRDVFIINDNGNILICYTNATPCPSAQQFTINGKVYSVSSTDSSLTLPSLKFNSYGNTGTTKVTLQVGARKIYIEQESGYIHE